ncbi:MAG TPA: hypothetical protein VHZ01_02130, partial [Casimicrobiaceae bacterium]|nr:hypothetical protein [Casimicrobiaceae bacterium]
MLGERIENATLFFFAIDEDADVRREVARLARAFYVARAPALVPLLKARFLDRRIAAHERASVQRAQARALVLDPLIDKPGQQIAAIALERLCDRASAQQQLELDGVATDRVRVQPDRLPICEQHRCGRDVRRLEEPPQRREYLAQAISPDIQLDTWPQHLDHLLARMP